LLEQKKIFLSKNETTKFSYCSPSLRGKQGERIKEREREREEEDKKTID
jgi:hypothetical protein